MIVPGLLFRDPDLDRFDRLPSNILSSLLSSEVPPSPLLLPSISTDEPPTRLVRYTLGIEEIVLNLAPSLFCIGSPPHKLGRARALRVALGKLLL
jgi:hypothetical protein